MSWFVKQSNFTINNFHPIKAIISNQQIAVEVHPLRHWSKLSCGTDGTRSFSHTANHQFHTERFGKHSHLVSFVHTCALHQFDVYSVVHLISAHHIRQTLQKLIGNNWQWTT